MAWTLAKVSWSSKVSLVKLSSFTLVINPLKHHDLSQQIHNTSPGSANQGAIHQRPNKNVGALCSVMLLVHVL